MVSDSIVELDGLTGYLSMPDKKTGRGLLLLHAWWGLNDFFKILANRFAAEGFVVFAPDYYDGKVAATADEATELRDGLDKKRTDVILKNAVGYLKRYSSIVGERIGVLGISLSTRFSINLARKMPNDIGAVVLFYGIGGGKFDQFKVPIQGHFAERDEWGAGPKAVEKFRARLAQGEIDFELYIYPGTTHWFLEEDVIEAYHQPSAELAFRRTVAFFDSHL